MGEMRPFVFVVDSTDSRWAFLGLCKQVPSTYSVLEFEHVYSVPPPELGPYQLHELVVFARVGFVGSPAPPVRRVLAKPRLVVQASALAARAMYTWCKACGWQGGQVAICERCGSALYTTKGIRPRELPPLESLDPRLEPEQLQLCEELRAGAAGEA